MKKSHLILAALMAAPPSTLMAVMPQIAYADFQLTKSEIGEVIDATEASCPRKSDDVGSVWASEPRYQTVCRNKLIAGNEAKMSAAYKHTLALLSRSEQSTLRAQQAVWVKTRYQECRRERNANLGGALRNVVFADCQLLELKRRTLWIAHPS